jgi:hypothetical protein
MIQPNNVNDTLARFVSMYGFFAIQYPKNWKQETDEAGHYVFCNEQGGSGVARIIVLENEYSGADAITQILAAIVTQNKEFSPSLLAAGKNKFVHFIKEHIVNTQPFTVYYWVTAFADKVVLITYTVQTSMKDMDTPIIEKQEMENMVASLEFLHEV